MNRRSVSLRSTIGLVALGLVLTACPTGDLDGDPGGDGGVADAATSSDGSAPAAPCGRLTTLCNEGDTCLGPPDCASAICFDGTCRTAAPADGSKNGDETDVDCGGSQAPACADGKGCLAKSDCTSGVCVGSVCQAATSTDQVQNGDETDVDCGGTSTAAPKCGAGQGCRATADCNMLMCDPVQKKCSSPSHFDGFKNDGETGIDCGGTAPNKCPTGQGCVSSADCNAVACDVGATNLCLPASHTDGIKNLGETGADCGGAAPIKCPAGQGCLVTTDCDNLLCDVAGTKLCLPPSHADGFKNLGETGVDCGGAALPAKCPTGQGCADGGDCDNVLCNAGTLVCDPPSKTDGLKNGTESDVDCGGGAPTNAPRCTDTLACGADADCSSVYCSNVGKCVAGRSCKAAVGGATSGITTCGKRETGDATKAHESCCRSLPLPVTTTVRLDKYEVTAGRMRQFIESVGPNLRKWAADEIAAGTPTGARLAYDLPPNMRAVLPASATPGDPLNLVMQIGSTVMDSRTPSMSQGCYQDATSPASGTYGANTYYWDHAVLKAHFGASIAARRFTQAQYDEKPMNCGAYWMYAAFCAWDGGRMPTQAEVNQAWGPQNYPWGTTTFTFPVSPGGGAYQYEQTANYFNNRNNATFPGFFYHFPDYGDAYDVSGYIAAPGRFILDKTTAMSANGESWMDLGANVMELVKAPASGSVRFCDFSITNGPGDVPDLAKCSDGGVAGVERATGLPNVGWVGGSWEGHRRFSVSAAAEPWFSRTSYTLNAQTQYGKTGVRCARSN